MSFFKYVAARYHQTNFDLYTLPPRTPQDKMMVGMKDFKLFDLLDCVLYNICGQSQCLKQDTIYNVINFLKGDFTDITKRTYLQVLVHFTMMDINLLYARYEALCTLSEVPVKRIWTIDECFDIEMSSFIMKVSQCYGADETVLPISQDDGDSIRNFLRRPSVISALHAALEHLLGPSDPDDLDLCNELSKMKIYSIKKFAPIDGFRGCCLLDGILVCSGGLSWPKGTANNIADLYTIALHVSCHYLARVKTNNLNFSSPHTFKSHDETVRLDPQSPHLPLGMGRYVELLMFGGIQPNWSKSSPKAAETFLQRLQTLSSFPVIAKTDHEPLKLEFRIPPSPPFGIDVEEYHDVFC